MKKLTILTAVAALAAFGWAGDVDAGPLSEDGDVTCVRSALNSSGFLDDEYTVTWGGGEGADFYAVTFECSSGRGGRSQDAEIDDPTITVDFTVGEFNGANGVKAGWVCHAWGKPLADDHKNSSNPNSATNHELGHDECNFDLGESP